VKHLIEVVSLDRHCKAFHSQIPLLIHHKSMEISAPLLKKDDKELKQIPAYSRELVYFVLEGGLLGVQMVRVDAYSISITKGVAFDWDSIEEAVINGMIMMFSDYDKSRILDGNDFIISGDVSNNSIGAENKTRGKQLILK
jgi:hypothetical protein